MGGDNSGESRPQAQVGAGRTQPGRTASKEVAMPPPSKGSGHSSLLAQPSGSWMASVPSLQGPGSNAWERAALPSGEAPRPCGCTQATLTLAWWEDLWSDSTKGCPAVRALGPPTPTLTPGAEASALRVQPPAGAEPGSAVPAASCWTQV